MELISELDALEAQEAHDVSTDPEERGRLRTIVLDYEEQERSAGRELYPEWSKRRKEEEIRAWGQFLDTEKNGLSGSKLTEFQRQYKDRPEEAAQVFTNPFLAHHYDVPVEEVDKDPERFRDDFARNALYLDESDIEGLTHEKFRSLASDLLSVKRDAAAFGQGAHMRGASLSQAMSEWHRENKGKPGYESRMRDATAYLQSAFEKHQSEWMPYEEDIETFKSGMEKLTGLEDDLSGWQRAIRATPGGAAAEAVKQSREEKGASPWDDLADIYLSIPEEKREEFLTIVGMRSADTAEGKTNLEILQERAFRRLQGIGIEGFYSPTVMDLVQAAREEIVANGVTEETMPPEELRQFNLLFDRPLRTGNREIRSAISENVEVPEEGTPEYDALSDLQKEALRRLDKVPARLRAYQEINDLIPVIDTAKGENIVSHAYGGIGDSLPDMVTLSMGGMGALAAFTAYSGESRTDIKRDYPEVSDEYVTAISNLTGVTRTLANKVEASVFQGMPAVRKWLNQATVASTGGISRWAAQTAGGIAVEVPAEVVDEVSQSAWQSLAHALDKDNPGVGLGDMLERTRGLFESDEFIPTIVMISLIGSGRASAREVRGTRAILGDHRMMVALGVEEATALDIANKARAGDMRGAQSELRKAFKGDKVLEQKAPTERAREAARSVAADHRRNVEAMKRGEALNLLPGIRKTETGWSLQWKDDSATEFDTFEDTMEEYWRQAEGKRLRIHDSDRAVITRTLRDLEAGREFEYEFKSEDETLLDAVEAGDVSREDALARVRAAVESEGAEIDVIEDNQGENLKITAEFDEAVTAAELQAMQEDDLLGMAKILGRNKSEWKGEVYRTTVRLLRNRNPLTAIEEKAEGDASFLIENPEARSWMVEAIRDYEQTHDDKVLADGDEVSDLQLKEAWSNLVVAYFAGTADRKAWAGEQKEGVSTRQWMGQLMRGKLGPAMEAYARLFRAAFQRAAKIRKARREGTLDIELERELARSAGNLEQFNLDREVLEEANEMLPFDLNESPPAKPPEPGEEAFSVAVGGPPVVARDAGFEQVMLPDGRVVSGPATFSIAVYHGTPHVFNAFDLGQIGSGEGHQAYGWGIYFAEDREVAESYRISLAYDPDKQRINGRQINEEYRRFTTANATDVDYQIAEGLERLMQHASPQEVIEYFEEVEYSEKAIQYFRDSDYSTFGALYEVELDIEQEDLLDFDNPLEQQSEKVREILSKSFGTTYEAWRKALGEKSVDELLALADNIDSNNTIRDSWDEWDPTDEDKRNDLIGFFDYLYEEDPENMADYVSGGASAQQSGQGIYHQIVTQTGSPKAASEALLAAGIKGIRYLDGNSRNTTITDKRLQRLFTDNDGNVEKTLDEYMASVYSPKKEKDALRADLKRKLESQTRNYVIFDADAAKILKRNGEPVPGGEGFSIVIDPAKAERHAELEARNDDGSITEEEIAEARQIVDEVAKANGAVGPVKRGDGTSFDIFDEERRGESTKAASARKAFFFTDTESAAQTFGWMSANNEAERVMREEQKEYAQQAGALLEKVAAGFTDKMITVAEEMNVLEERQARLLRKVFIDGMRTGLMPMARGMLAKSSLSDPLILRAIASEAGVELQAEDLSAWLEVESKRVSESSPQWLLYRENKKRELGLEEKGVVREFYLFPGEVREIDYEGESSRSGPTTYANAIDEAAERGDGGVIFRNTLDAGEVIDIYAVFDSRQIKSADPFTGVPLSQRFDRAKKEIGYSVIISTEHLRNDDRFDSLVREGRVETGVNIDAFGGESILLHAPDNAFAGKITFAGGESVEGKGGVYYPALFADENYFWASTRNAAQTMAKHLNVIGEKNGGRVLMGLVSSPVEKLFSSTTMSTGVVRWMTSLAGNARQSGVSRAKLNSMLAKASKVTEEKRHPETGKLRVSKFPFTLLAKDGLEANLSKIEKLLEPDAAVFGVRKAFVESLATQLAAELKGKKAQSRYVADMLADAENKHAKQSIRRGTLSKASILQGLGNLFTEPFLRDFQEHGTGNIYAVVEVEGKVKAIESDLHDSYPFTVVPVDPDAKVKVSILGEAVDWQDAVGTEDGRYTDPADRKKHFPTSGVSSTNLQVIGKKGGARSIALGFSITLKKGDSEIRYDLSEEAGIDIDWMETHPESEGLGKMTELFRELLDKHPDHQFGTAWYSDQGLGFMRSFFRKNPGYLDRISCDQTQLLAALQDDFRDDAEATAIIEPKLARAKEEFGSGFSVILDAGDRIDAAFDAWQQEPEARADMANRARKKVAEVKELFADLVSVERTRKGIDEERKARRDERLYDRAERELGTSRIAAIEGDEPSLDDASEYPTINAIRSDWRMVAKSKAKKNALPEYDDIGGASRIRGLFGGIHTPDQVADALGFESVSELWGQIDSEHRTFLRRREQYREDTKRFNEIKAEETAASLEWAAEQYVERNNEIKDRDVIITALRTLNAALSVLPPEVRGRVGGMLRVAQLVHPRALLEELERRIAKMDVEIERFLKDETEKAKESLWEKIKKKRRDEKGKTAGSKLIPEFWSLFEAANDAILMTRQEGEAAAVGAENLANTLATEGKYEEAQTQIMKAEVIRRFAEWNNRSAADRTDAIMVMEDFVRGAVFLRMEEEAKRRESREAQRESIITGTRGTVEKAARTDKEIEAEGFKGKWKQIWWDLRNWDQLISRVIPGNAQLAEALIDQQRIAENHRFDLNQEVSEKLAQLFTDLGDGDVVRGEQIVYSLGLKKGTKADRRLLPRGLEPKPVVIKGETYSQLEAITALLMWKQEDGRRHMEGVSNAERETHWSYTQADMDGVRHQLTPRAKRVMRFLEKEYADEYDKINPYYRKFYGIDLPKNANYSPLSVKPVQEADESTIDPGTGMPVTGHGVPGSFRTRGIAVAEPDFKNAIDLFLSHSREMNHFVSHAEFARESSAILGNREVLNAIESVGGKEARRTVAKWLGIFKEGGVRQAAAGGAFVDLARKMGRNAVQIALFAKIGTLLVQGSQLAAASAEMPRGDYFTRLGKLVTGKMGWGKALKSEYIQRRLQEQPVAVRYAVQQYKDGPPNRLRHWHQRVGNLIGGVDALMTAGTYAIVFDYQMNQLEAAGVPESSRARIAAREAERITDRVAQPTRQGSRSLAEMQSQHPWMIAAWAFGSEARKNLMVILDGLSSTDKQRRSQALTFWIVTGIFEQVLRRFWQDLRDDEDEDFLDAKHWHPRSILTGMATSPAHGFPVIGKEVENLVRKTAGGDYVYQGGSIFNIENLSDVWGLFSEWDDVTVEKKLRQLHKVTGAVGTFNADAAAVTSFLSLLRDLQRIGVNLAE